MEKTKIVLYSLVHALTVLAYISGFAYAVHTAGNTFIDIPDMLGMVVMLLLFVFSAGLMALLVFGRPVYLFVTGMKKEGIMFLGFTMGWLLILILIMLSIILLMFGGSSV